MRPLTLLNIEGMDYTIRKSRRSTKRSPCVGGSARKSIIDFLIPSSMHYYHPLISGHLTKIIGFKRIIMCMNLEK